MFILRWQLSISGLLSLPQWKSVPWSSRRDAPCQSPTTGRQLMSPNQTAFGKSIQSSNKENFQSLMENVQNNVGTEALCKNCFILAALLLISLCRNINQLRYWLEMRYAMHTTTWRDRDHEVRCGPNIPGQYITARLYNGWQKTPKYPRMTSR